MDEEYGPDGLPAHCMIALNADGDGPETDPDKIVRWQCWCLDPGCEDEKRWLALQELAPDRYTADDF